MDPDLQIRGGGGRESCRADPDIRSGGGLKIFLALQASVWSKSEGGGGGPLGPSPGSPTAKCLLQ